MFDNIKKYLKNFFKSKINIVLISSIGLFLFLVLLGSFVDWALVASYFTLALILFVVAIKFFKISKVKIRNTNVFFEENVDKDYVKNPNRRSYIIAGICFLVLSLVIAYSVFKNFF